MSDRCCRRRLSWFWEAGRTIGLLSRNGEEVQSSAPPGPVVDLTVRSSRNLSLSLIRRIFGSSHRPQADLRSAPGANLIILPLLHSLLRLRLVCVDGDVQWTLKWVTKGPNLPLTSADGGVGGGEGTGDRDSPLRETHLGIS